MTSSPVPEVDLSVMTSEDREIAETNRSANDDTFGPCIFCGREQTRNPHPHAGEPGHPEAGYVWHCVPCLEENRHRWARRAMRAEAVIRSALSLVDCFDPSSGSGRARTFVNDLRNMLGAERV